MSQPAIDVQNLGKKYRVGEFTGGTYRDLRDVIMDTLKGLMLMRPRPEPEAQEFWALRNINLKVEQLAKEKKLIKGRDLRNDS